MMNLTSIYKLFSKEQSTIVFKLSDYGLDLDERRLKFKDYDLILCEKCNQKLDESLYYCRDCFKKETDGIERNHMYFGKCKECFQVNTFYNWCLRCNSNHFRQDFDKWTSRNKDIDKLIQDIQLLAEFPRKVLEWIPYNRFNDIKFIAEGGFAKVYSATWIDGQIKCWDRKSNNWKRNKQSKFKVALKVFNNSSKNISKDFINETEFFSRVNYYAGLIYCYGITQEPNTQNYALVLQFMENGSLRSYLDRNFNSITWEQKLSIIYSISAGLHFIHISNLTHKNLHSGNVLQHLIGYGSAYTTYISDFGYCKPADENSSNSDKNIYGVMPYTAPEILCGKKHTMESDVYSLGIIINEVISIIPPFNKEPHNYNLALDICHGKRPKIREETPEFLKELIKKCLDAIPENRPTSYKVWNELYNYKKGYTNQVEELEELSYDFTESTQFETHAQAIYTSRLLNFSNLPEPVNCLNQEEFISSSKNKKRGNEYS